MHNAVAVIVLWSVAAVGAQAPAQPARAAVMAAATDIMQKARYCTLITMGADGHPQARIVDPLPPDASFTIWVGTNPLTRKVAEVRRNPRVTLSCFDAGTASYITLLGRGSVVTDAVEKAKHWKAEWAPFYPHGPSGDDFMLLRIAPQRLEIVSESRQMLGDAKTWQPLAIEFPGQ